MITQFLTVDHPRFAQCIARPDHEIDLAEAALRIAQDAYPRLDVTLYLTQLDAMADAVRVAAGPRASAEATFSALVDWFEEQGFRGNTTEYYDPRNSYLNDALDRRLGIPITLALVLLEVGRRVSLPLAPVGLPGHFVLAWAGEGERFWIDPFYPRRRLTEANLDEMVRDVQGRPVVWDPQWLDTVSHRQFLTRMLNNLRSIFMGRQDFQRVVPVLEKLLLLNPTALEEMRDLGLLMLHAERPATAARYLEPYLTARPGDKDADLIQQRLEADLTMLALRN
jgi:regulator of sirC expression with transglutaminase-like and TPR domain